MQSFAKRCKKVALWWLTPKVPFAPLPGLASLVMCCKDGFPKCHCLLCQGWHCGYKCHEDGWLDGPKIPCLVCSTKVVGCRVVGLAPQWRWEGLIHDGSGRVWWRHWSWTLSLASTKMICFILCNSLKRFMAWSMPTLMLFSQVFSSYNFLSISFLRDKETMLSFQATMILVSCSVFSVMIGGLIIVGFWVAINMNAVAGRVCGRRKSGFFDRVWLGAAKLWPNSLFI